MMVCSDATPEPAAAQATQRTSAADPFIGRWRLDPSRSRSGDEMKVASDGGKRYTFDLGGGPETIVADGTDQPGVFGTTLSVSAEKPNVWKVVRKMGDRIMLVAEWVLSADGATLTDHFSSYQADGSIRKTDYLFKRTAGNASFAGTWEDTTPPSPLELEIEAFESDGLSFINLTQKTTKSLKFDGKRYPITGVNMPASFASSGRRVNERAIQLFESIGDKPYDTQQAELSADSKTLTMTVQPQNASKPRILIFDRE
ncbi:hypothetical protein DYQ86_23480 [Acidobacteria bacterium AB60]|nr:hypothetical protein DYQ86_23480 [Acidobacteria bacterium AB60]